MRIMAKVYAGEAIAAGLSLAVTGAAVALTQWRGIRIDYASFAGRYLLGAVLLGIAVVYRKRNRAPRISLTLISCALFVFFTNGGAVLNYALIPHGAVPIDPLLVRADVALGFDWASFAQWVSTLSGVSPALRYVYVSSLFQLALLIIVLGFGGQRVALHRFMLVGMLCGVASIAIWSLAPSLGPASLATLAPGVELRLARVLNADYTRQVFALLRDGPRTVDANHLLGLISFPSMHTVMAAMAVTYSRRTFAFWPLVALNAAMVPAILIHGEHHLIDLIGGLALFAIAWAWVRVLVQAESGGAAALQVHTASGGRLIKIASMLPPVFRPNSVPRS